MKIWITEGFKTINGMYIAFYGTNHAIHYAEYHNKLSFQMWLEHYGKVNRDFSNGKDLPLYIRRNVPPMNFIGIQLREYNAWSPKKL